MNLNQFHALHSWHLRHASQRPLERQVWDTVLILWLMGWVGVPTAWLLNWQVLSAASLLLLFLPGAYVALRAHLHRRAWLRCDWIVTLR